jgi:hypothetical protein
MFSLEIYVIYDVMTLRYILTNTDYTLCVILKDFKLQLMTLNHILTNVVCDLYE